MRILYIFMNQIAAKYAGKTFLLPKIGDHIVCFRFLQKMANTLDTLG